jgi:hypothetical protein
MKNTFGLAVLLAALGWGHAFSLVAEVIPVLQTGSQTYTNAEVLDITGSHVYVRAGGTISSLNLKDLDPSWQKHFGYDPAKEAAKQAALAYAPKAVVSYGDDNAPSVPKPGFELSLTNKSAPSDWVETDFPIDKNGALSLTLPKIWKGTVTHSAPAEAAAISVRIQPEYGSNFFFVVTTVPATNHLNRLDGRGLLELAARPYLANSEEQQVHIKNLSGTDSDGVYYTLSDKALEQGLQKSGKHKFQSQGYIKLSDFGLSFVVLYDYPDSMEFRAALKVIQTARYKTREEMGTARIVQSN